MNAEVSHYAQVHLSDSLRPEGHVKRQFPANISFPPDALIYKNKLVECFTDYTWESIRK